MERHLYTWCGTNSIHKACYRSFIQGLGQIVYTGPGTDRIHRAWDRSYTQGLGQMFYTGPWTELLALSFLQIKCLF